MNICLVGSILRHRIITDKGEYGGWGGATESAIAPFAALLGAGSKIYFVGNVGQEDIEELKDFFKKNYPLVDTSGIGINPGGTDLHVGTKDHVSVKIQMEPTRYEQIKPYLAKSDIVIFNFGNVDDIDPEAIRKVKENSKAFVYVDVHRKPFAADKRGYFYTRGWSDWATHLAYADAVQMNRMECEALFGKEIKNIDSAIQCVKAVLDAGIPQVFITLRDKGVLTAHRGMGSYEYAIAPTVQCKPVDLTGCGDAFAAG